MGHSQESWIYNFEGGEPVSEESWRAAMEAIGSPRFHPVVVLEVQTVPVPSWDGRLNASKPGPIDIDEMDTLSDEAIREAVPSVEEDGVQLVTARFVVGKKRKYDIHDSHEIRAFRGGYACKNCGARAVQRAVGLAGPCRRIR